MTERRTKVEWTYTNSKRTRAIVRERFVDNGRTKRIICTLDAKDSESLYWQIQGVLKYADSPSDAPKDEDA